MAQQRIEITYQMVTPESAAEGAVAEHGFCSPGGYDHPMEPACVGEAFKKWKAENVVPCWEFDSNAEGDCVAQAVQFLQANGYAEPSASSFCEGVWYSWADEQPDYETGDSRTESAHLNGFTPVEEEEIYERITGRFYAPAGTGRACGAANDCARNKLHSGKHANRNGDRW